MIQRVRAAPGGHDHNGDPVESTTATTTIPAAFTAPRESSEISDRGRAGVIVGLDLFVPDPHFDLRHTDQVRSGPGDDELFDIEGEVGRWIHPFSGWEAGLVAALRRAKG